MICRAKLLVNTSLPRGNRFLTSTSNNHDYYDYYLKNDFGDHSLAIKDCGKYFIIDGSLRKWFLGSESLDDLSLKTLISAIDKIALTLGVKAEYIYNSRILIIEFGGNYNIGIDCSSVIERIYRYSSLNRCPQDNYVMFKGKTGTSFVCYGKVKEMRKEKLYGGNRILRIEVRCSKFSATSAMMCGAETILDVIKSYRMIVVSFLKEVKRLEMQPVLLGIEDAAFYGKKIKAFKDYQLLRLIHSDGARKVLEFLKQLDMASSGKSIQSKKVRNLMAQYADSRSFRKEDLIRIIIKRLAAEISASSAVSITL
jgi:hypothetical protein